MKKPPDKPIFRTIKTSLKSITKDDNIQSIINGYVCNINKIIILTYQFIRLYHLHKYKNDKELPQLNKEFILYCIKTVSEPKTQRGQQKNKVKNKDIKEELKIFYKNEFKPLLVDTKYSYTNCTYILNIIADEMCRCYMTNMKEHFVSHLFRYINSIFKPEFNEMINKETDSKKKKELRKLRNKELREIKNDIIYNTFDKSSEKYHQWIRDNKKILVPIELDKGNVYYDVKAHPEKYFTHSFYINEQLEKLGKKLYQPLPLRNNIVPKYIPIDTASLIDMLAKKGEKGKLLEKTKKNGNYIWYENFKIEKLSIFNQNGYVFYNRILTDGIGCSIIFIKEEYKDKKWGQKLPKQDLDEDYQQLFNLKKKETDKLKNRKLIGLDPGKRDIFFMTDGEKSLRYSSLQRRQETHAKKCRDIIHQEKIKNKIIEKETQISLSNSKSINYEKFKEFVKIKNKINKDLFDFYEKELFRKLKWRRFTHTQRSESKIINNIKDTFGSNILIGYGNWSHTQQMKNFIPTPNKGMRKLIAKNFDIVIVDEYKTSKLCHNCCSENDNKKYKVNNHYRKFHKVLVCQNDKCCTIWNRDLNGGLNILRILKEFINNRRKVKEFQRSADG